MTKKIYILIRLLSKLFGYRCIQNSMTKQDNVVLNFLMCLVFSPLTQPAFQGGEETRLHPLSGWAWLVRDRQRRMYGGQPHYMFSLKGGGKGLGGCGASQKGRHGNSQAHNKFGNLWVVWILATLGCREGNMGHTFRGKGYIYLTLPVCHLFCLRSSRASSTGPTKCKG